jgi:hypothetical protein
MTGALWVRPFDELMAVADEIYDRAVAVCVEAAVNDARRSTGHGGGRLSPGEEVAVRACGAGSWRGDVC